MHSFYTTTRVSPLDFTNSYLKRESLTDQMETNSLSEYLAIFLVVGNDRFGKQSWTIKIAEELAEEGCFS